jgi:signal peptidase I
MAKNENRRSRTQEPPTPEPAPEVPISERSLMSLWAQWLLSRTVRQANAMRRHVEKLFHHQRDILSPQASAGLQSAARQVRAAIHNRAPKQDLEKQMELLEQSANKWLKPYPNAAWRENIEVLLVALSVAMGIRTFFLQPFKIPTGSMQPTLYGVTSNPLGPGDKIPTGLTRVREWFEGVSYLHLVADTDGQIEAVEPPVRFLIFNIKQTIYFGGQAYTLWFPPDYGNSTLQQRAGIQRGQSFRRGEDILKLRVVAGDHLFVDRVTYNFQPPQRGEIIVFETKGIPEQQRDAFGIPGDQFYIKRLVALGGERVQISQDRHLIINGKELDASTPHFEKIYAFPPKSEPSDSHYSGHVNLTQLFRDHPEGVNVPKDNYLVMGDNTMNSLDSRFWGAFPSSYVIGKAFFVYWPITDRFGWGYHR